MISEPCAAGFVRWVGRLDTDGAGEVGIAAHGKFIQRRLRTHAEAESWARHPKPATRRSGAYRGGTHTRNSNAAQVIPMTRGALSHSIAQICRVDGQQVGTIA